MTDIPQKYTDEAIRRMNADTNFNYWLSHPTVQRFAAALLELGWEPPVDPLLLKAREIVANAHQERGWMSSAKSVRQGVFDHHVAVKAVLTALKENSNA